MPVGPSLSCQWFLPYAVVVPECASGPLALICVLRCAWLELSTQVLVLTRCLFSFEPSSFRTLAVPWPSSSSPSIRSLTLDHSCHRNRDTEIRPPFRCSAQHELEEAMRTTFMIPRDQIITAQPPPAPNLHSVTISNVELYVELRYPRVRMAGCGPASI